MEPFWLLLLAGSRQQSQQRCLRGFQEEGRGRRERNGEREEGDGERKRTVLNRLLKEREKSRFMHLSTWQTTFKAQNSRVCIHLSIYRSTYTQTHTPTHSTQRAPHTSFPSPFPSLFPFLPIPAPPPKHTHTNTTPKTTHHCSQIEKGRDRGRGGGPLLTSRSVMSLKMLSVNPLAVFPARRFLLSRKIYKEHGTNISRRSNILSIKAR